MEELLLRIEALEKRVAALEAQAQHPTKEECLDSIGSMLSALGKDIDDPLSQR